MTIRRIDPDEAVTINGVQVTGRRLAEARQELSHRGVYNPRWAELTEQEQETAALAAGSYLRSLADLVPTIGDALEQCPSESPVISVPGGGETTLHCENPTGHDGKHGAMRYLTSWRDQQQATPGNAPNPPAVGRG